MINVDNKKNIYDIRKEESLMFIVPTDSILKESEKKITEKIAIAINLYYVDTVDFYLQYIDNIPNEIDTYIISSVLKIWDIVEEYKQDKENVYLLKKENRGRDISALLVTFRELALEYEYICFLHDKKEHYLYLKEDVDTWIWNLWGNTIGTEKYIKNVLNLFRSNPKLGILVPPEPIGEYIECWYGSAWANNFENTKKLASELNLECNLAEDKQPITIGTVFWARICCLEKLFKKNWKYTDFPKEPLADDGTISHAIERIFSYVAQDAGYTSGTVMSSDYAEWKLLFLQDGMRKMHGLIREELGVRELYQMDKEYLNQFRARIKDFFKKNRYIYLYGAGFYGKELLSRIRKMGLEPKGFVVSDGRRNDLYLEDLKVYELQEVIGEEATGIIISLNYGLQEEIAKNLLERGFTNFIRGNIPKD